MPVQKRCGFVQYHEVCEKFMGTLDKIPEKWYLILSTRRDRVLADAKAVCKEHGTDERMVSDG